MSTEKITTIKIFNTIKGKDCVIRGEDIYWKTKRALIGRNWHPHTDFSKIFDLKHIEKLHIEIEGWLITHRVNLPEELSTRLIDYLRNSSKFYDEFDCMCFIHFLKNIQYQIGEFYTENWNFSQIHKAETLQIGETILIVRKENDGHYVPLHGALYIGKGLFISKLGQGAGIYFATLAEMIKGYRGTEAFLMKLKTQER